MELKVKPHKDGKYTESLYTVYYYLSLKCLTAEEGATAAKRHLNINTAGLIKQIFCKYFDLKIEVKR